jgi:WD40 repeat protein
VRHRSAEGHLQIFDPEAGLALHKLRVFPQPGALRGYFQEITQLMCFDPSSPLSPDEPHHHPRVVSAALSQPVRVWDGETGERVSELARCIGSQPLAVWKEHWDGHDRIAVVTQGSKIDVYDAETLTVLHTLRPKSDMMFTSMLPFKSSEGPTRLLVAPRSDRGMEIWEPEEGVLLHDRIITKGSELWGCHLFESAEGRQLLAVGGKCLEPRIPPGETDKAFLDVWDLGKAFMEAQHVRPANKHG